MPLTFDWPEALRPASVDWQLITPQAVGRSIFDGSSETDSLGAPRWAFTITTGPMKRVEIPQWEAHFGRLRGQINRVNAWDWRREAPLGPATGAPVVFASALGSSVQLQGWTPSVAGILLAGSWMGINGELKRLTGDISSDFLGQATATFEPPLRAAPPVGAPIILVKPTAKFICTSPAISWAQEGAKFPTKTFTFEEELRP